MKENPTMKYVSMRMFYVRYVRFVGIIGRNEPRVSIFELLHAILLVSAIPLTRPL